MAHPHSVVRLPRLNDTKSNLGAGTWPSHGHIISVPSEDFTASIRSAKAEAEPGSTSDAQHFPILKT